MEKIIWTDLVGNEEVGYYTESRRKGIFYVI
jgi:hypothetical protein